MQMDTTTVVVVGVVIALIVLALVAWAYSGRRRSAELRERFGPEYERVVSEYGDQKIAEDKLRERQERVEALELRTLAPEERVRFSRTWREVQSRFVDAPAEAVTQANTLVKEVMQERGYPEGTFDQRAENLSVRHPELVQNYRAAREIARRNERREASTEDLRQAMVHYRALFEELLHEADTKGAETRRAA
ncbi:MAG TPA: hypothetical protein VFX49_13915 [Chloroflexota bacterium]|nr:hypothetical protein [Chloroflexota bacterium]